MINSHYAWKYSSPLSKQNFQTHILTLHHRSSLPARLHRRLHECFAQWVFHQEKAIHILLQAFCRPAFQKCNIYFAAILMMVSHRVRVTNASEVDRELIAWLRQAYEQA